jgi:hypothetical protein
MGEQARKKRTRGKKEKEIEEEVDDENSGIAARGDAHGADRERRDENEIEREERQTTRAARGATHSEPIVLATSPKSSITAPSAVRRKWR